jgi:hypothetical protein
VDFITNPSQVSAYSNTAKGVALLNFLMFVPGMRIADYRGRLADSIP